jgi:hypothetical protein
MDLSISFRIGEADGFRSVFPAQAGAQLDSNGLVVQTGSMRRGCGHNCQTVLTTRKIISGWAPVLWSASHAKNIA